METYLALHLVCAFIAFGIYEPEPDKPNELAKVAFMLMLAIISGPMGLGAMVRHTFKPKE